MMITFPIFIPSFSSGGTELIVPKWAEIMAYIGTIVVMLGIMWLISAFVLSIITDKIDPFEKPHVYSLALAVGGFGILLIALMLMLLTGQSVE